MLFECTVYHVSNLGGDGLGIALDKLDRFIVKNASLSHLLSLFSVRIRKNFLVMKLKIGLSIEG